MSSRGECPGCNRKSVVLQDDGGICRQCVNRRTAGQATWTAVLTTLTPAGNIGQRQWTVGLTWAEATGVMAETLQAGKACEAWLYRDDIEWKKGTH